MKTKTKTEPKKDGFVKSDRHLFKGITLHPWTPDRAIAAQSMGMLWPRIGPEGRDQLRRLDTWPGMTKDIIIALWLCSQSDGRVKLADAIPGEAYEEARRWGQRLNLHEINKQEFWDAYGIFIDIMSEVEDAKTVGKPKQDDEPIGEESDADPT